MENKRKNIGCEVSRYCSSCYEITAQYVHETDSEDIIIYECLCCGKKDEEIIYD